MRILSVFLIIGICTSFAFSAAAADGVNMQEGLWEITSKASIQGMPFDMPPTTYTQCLTKENIIPQEQNQEQQECKLIDSDISGNTVTWSMACSQNGMTSNISGKISYKGTTMAGTMKVESNTPMGNSLMNMITNGKRIGDCN